MDEQEAKEDGKRYDKEVKDKPVMRGRVSVYVPIGEAEVYWGIKLGSGIVGQEAGKGEVEIYFEGNLYGAVNLTNYAERCYCAAGRMKTRYPTVARRVVQAAALRYIGFLDLRSGDIHLEVDPTDATVTNWIDLSDEQELSAPSVKARLEHKLGQAVMRNPGQHALLLAQLPHLEGKARMDVLTRAALSLDDD